MIKNEMIEITEEERVVLQQFRELGRWGSLVVIKQNGALDRIEKTEKIKISVQKGNMV